MNFNPGEIAALQGVARLEKPLAEVEACLAALGQAVRDRDPDAIGQQAAALHRCLAQAVELFGGAARSGGVPSALRQRLAIAGGQVAAHREALARATASLDRAIDVLLPASAPAIYSPTGTADRASSVGNLHA